MTAVSVPMLSGRAGIPDPADPKHRGDLTDAAHCTACAWLAGYRAGRTDADDIWPVDDRAWRRAVERAVGSDVIQTRNDRARADRPGDREGDYRPGDPVAMPLDGWSS
jgi:hypothetical protein